jgi:hypothetical protein
VYCGSRHHRYAAPLSPTLRRLRTFDLGLRRLGAATAHDNHALRAPSGSAREPAKCTLRPPDKTRPIMLSSAAKGASAMCRSWMGGTSDTTRPRTLIPSPPGASQNHRRRTIGASTTTPPRGFEGRDAGAPGPTSFRFGCGTGGRQLLGVRLDCGWKAADVPTMYHAIGKQRGTAVNNGDLKRLITRRSQVQILPPPPTKLQVRAGPDGPALVVQAQTSTGSSTVLASTASGRSMS